MPAYELIDQAIEARDRGQYELAMRLFERLANDGHPYGLVLLANMHMEGLGTTVDLSKAETLLDQAVSLGSNEAAFQKAALWLVRGDLQRYFESLRQAKRMGSLPAAYRLALCYARGSGVTRDSKLAGALMSEAAARGHVGAKMHIARALVARPIDPIGFSRGVFGLLAGFFETLRIGTRNPDDERLR